MKRDSTNLIYIAIIAFSLNANARENIGTPGSSSTINPQKSIMSGCVNATAQADLDINNVRAKILNGGDMWWDIFGTTNASYQIPKLPSGQTGSSSQYATSLWIGGIDAGKQLKCAAQTYRQDGNDYWPGPLTSSATADPTACVAWDKFFKINRIDVANYYNWVQLHDNSPNPVSQTAMDVINSWPAYGPEGQPLAPYWDVNADGIYDPAAGDVPDFDITNTRACKAQLFGDQCLFWVFNDKGNIHTQSGCSGIGLEIQAQAFAFATNDEINNSTFYKYKIINKSSFRLDSTFFGVFDDADLGWYKDDYVGCDVSLGLGFCYNGTAVDGTGQLTAYGANPPAVGIDFFEGPFADPDGLANPSGTKPPSFLNYGDSTIDNERLGMCKFIYYNNNSNVVNGEPKPGDDFYQYLTGTWKNGTSVTYGGNGTSGSIKCDYMFPGSSDQSHFYGTNGVAVAPWDETGNTPDDRRFLESAGPFVLQPGAVNTVTIGVPWARATSGGPLASVALLKGADAKAQLLFNNCFGTLNGPTAPNLSIQELNQELILTWSNPKNSNNANENYKEDPDKGTGLDSAYRFQGYQVYQLKDEFVSSNDLYNIDKARLVLQCDKVDNVKQIINYKKDQNLNALVPQEMVNGSNTGIVHSISVKEDKFATGDNHLVNHKTYYFAIIAYGYTSTPPYYNAALKPPGPDFAAVVDYFPYISGRFQADGAGVFEHHAIPHIPSPEVGGTIQQSTYGMGPKLKRIEGRGNAGQILNFTAATVSEILSSSSNMSLNPVYENTAGPVNIKVIDPLNVPAGNFRFTIHGSTDAATWSLIKLPGGNAGDTVFSENNIKFENEQIINGEASPMNPSVYVQKWGISVNTNFTHDPGNSASVNNGFIEATMSFDNDDKRWLTGIKDQDGTTDFNWIRSGTAIFTGPDAAYNDYVPNPNPALPPVYPNVDSVQAYEKVLEGTWAPYKLCAPSPATSGSPLVCKGAPAWGTITSGNLMKNLASVDVIITNDKSKWTRCPVLEMQDEPTLAVGNAKKLDLRKAASVDKQGLDSTKAGFNAAEGFVTGHTGMGWFPGYAINLETGERLNMAFGEDSWLATDHGNDMVWNPSSNIVSSNGDPIFGGKHYIYVFGHNADTKFAANAAHLPNEFQNIPRYDAGDALYKLLVAASTPSFTQTLKDAYKKLIYSDAMWVNIPLLAEGHSIGDYNTSSPFESDVTVKLRVSKPFAKYATGKQNLAADNNLEINKTYFVEIGPINHNAINYATGSTFKAVNNTWLPVGTLTNASVRETANNADPMYEFNTSDIETHKNNAAAAESALDIINMVPNPYYAYSAYEKSSAQDIVKITNLPESCTVSIYALNGTLIRQFKRDESKIVESYNKQKSASLDWDLKNQARIPVASGMYIVNVDVPGVGEKTLKWFGVMRPLDLESY
jgi:hypothetical protein